MTQGTEIERLDYTREPPEYRIDAGGGLQQEGFRWWRPGCTNPGCADCKALDFVTAEKALASAWTHHKRFSNPPGMVFSWAVAGGTTGTIAFNLSTSQAQMTGGYWVGFIADTRAVAAPDRLEARAAGWKYYDRRLALANKGAAWPLVLTWSDEVCAAAETHPAQRAEDSE